MKRIGNLHCKITDRGNVELADRNARRGKSSNYGVKLHDRNRENNINELIAAMGDLTIRTSPYTEETISNGAKKRNISKLPYYPDLIRTHAESQVLAPLWRKVYPYNTYSCIPGRGISACAERVKKIIRKYDGKPLYALTTDIQKFYQSIDHETMKQVIRKKLKCDGALALLDEQIESHSGMVIGGYLSPQMANLLLSYLIHYVNRVMKVDCVEYADDIVYFSDSKQRLREVLEVVMEYYAEHSLTLKSNWQIFPIAVNRQDRNGRALDFIGFKFYRKQTLLRKHIKQNLCRKVARLRKKGVHGKELRIRISAWLGWAMACDSKHLLKTILKEDYESVLRPKAC